VMSADSVVTYSSVYFEARSWSIPSEDPYEEAAQQLFEQAPHSPEYVPRNHVQVFIPEFEHHEDLVPAEDEAPASLLPPGFLSPQLGFPRLIHRLGIGHYLLLLDLGVRALEVRVAVLETHAHRLEWQSQATDDLVVQHIMRTQAMEAGARVDTLEDTGSSS
nr:hypothetical protein [Tanacetum cinerariifolium]